MAVAGSRIEENEEAGERPQLASMHEMKAANVRRRISGHPFMTERDVPTCCVETREKEGLVADR
jgi:hypothetical protein